MSRNKKILLVLIVVLSIGAIATTLGLTSAYWVGASGDSEVAPQTDTTDWNYWIKYFIYAPVKNSSGAVSSYEIVGFSGAVYENVIIPRKVYGTISVLENDKITTVTIDENSPYAVTLVKNSTFADTTDKTVPVTLTLPTSVNIEPGTFMGLTNLTTIKIIQVSNLAENAEVHNIDVGGQNAFIGCYSLQQIIIDGVVTINGYSATTEEGQLNSTTVLNSLKEYLAVAGTVGFVAQ